MQKSPMASRNHPTRLRCRGGNGQGASEVIRCTQRQNAQGELVLDEAVNGRIERAIATAHDDEIQLRSVMLNPCRNLCGILDRCRDQLKVQVVKAARSVRVHRD